MNILSIGNSFSTDAQRYLHQIAWADGVDIDAFNLFIGGCSLSQHYQNMLSEEQAYTLEMNGSSTGFKVSLKTALLNRSWDIVTLQQASINSHDYSTYQPYLQKLVDYVRLCVPKAKIVIHQTWAYEQDSELLSNAGYADYRDMLGNIKISYQKAAHNIGADFIIPSGEMFHSLLENGIKKVHRDTFHASLGIGRYALGLTWYRFLTGNEVVKNTFSDFEECVSAQEIAIIKKCISDIADKYGV